MSIFKQKISKRYFISMCAIYFIALLTCAIVNMSINHSFTWFYIVLSSVLTAFTVTNIPALCKKGKLIISYITMNASFILLFFIISKYVKNDNMFGLALKLWIFPFALFCMPTIIISLKINRWLKAAALLLAIGVAALFINIYVDRILSIDSALTFARLLSFKDWGSDILAVKAAGFAGIGCAGIAFIIGLIRGKRQY